MAGGTRSGDGKPPEPDGRTSAPSISLPKGGGAIRGIGEKFSVNSASGTGATSVPIAVSPGRSGFGPQISLGYDSGGGNGPFGFGWSINLPHITRRTDKGLPQYHDLDESDVFLISGAEDLVPLLNADGSRSANTASYPGFLVQRYRPRIESSFDRIERWTRTNDGDVHWRSISRDNILTIYGKDETSRISDPADPRRVFTWLICERRDDKGNAVIYEHKPEDGAGANLSLACERNRGQRSDPRRAVNRYIKRILYGNRLPLLDAGGRRPRLVTSDQVRDAKWMFEVVFDYGEHSSEAPTPAEATPWAYRADPFSSYRAGFEIRTTRLCERVLMFHHFPDEPIGDDCLVRSTDLGYGSAQAGQAPYSFLRSVTQNSYVRQAGGYLKRGLPPLEFEYSEPVVQHSVQTVDAASLEDLRTAVDGTNSRLVDLHGEGAAGILTEQDDAWFYKSNIGIGFAPLRRVRAKPNNTLAGGQAQLMDLSGDGRLDLVVLDGPMQGFYEHDDAEEWRPFHAFARPINRKLSDPNARMVDLDGDGVADVLITEDEAFVCYASLAERGFSPAWRTRQKVDEEEGPRLVFADGKQSIFLGDFSGDGLSDLVRIRNGEICYWPNLGYGRFGAKITMDGAPWFDRPDQFANARIRLVDIDGSGTTDLVYLHRDGVHIYFNCSGNSWSPPTRLPAFPRVDNLVSIYAADLWGKGTACLVWSSSLPSDAHHQMRYVDLMGGRKPHLLVRIINNLGAETRIEYAASTKFYLQDKYAGTPWLTRLPFPVQVVERVETFDYINRNRFTVRYAYHHGYFDGVEREFRGFGMVEQWDTEDLAAVTGASASDTGIDASSYVPPAYTKTWFHTGAFLGEGRISRLFAGDAVERGDYYRPPGLTDDQARALLLSDSVLPSGLTPDEQREATRALKGAMLRQEIYARDNTPKAAHPYLVAEQNFSINCLQQRSGNRHAVFLSHISESLQFHYERNPADPRMQHVINLEVDAYGNMLKEVSIGYGRRQPVLGLPLHSDQDKQTRALITYTENSLTNAIDDVSVHPDDYRTPLAGETELFELTAYTPTGPSGRYQAGDFIRVDAARPGELIAIFDSEIAYEQAPTNGRQRRLIKSERTLYRPDDLGTARGDPLFLLPLGQVESLALVGESYKLAFTAGLLAQVFQREGQALLPNPADILAVDLSGGAASDRGGYVDLGDGRWWAPSGRAFLSLGTGDTAAQELANARAHFFLPCRFRDPFHTRGASTEKFIVYDAYDLLAVESRDAAGNRITAGARSADGTVQPANDYRVLQPRLVSDANRNRTEVSYDALGMVVGTAVMGKPEGNLGDSLSGFQPDLSDAVVADHIANPLSDPMAILGRATTRLVYDLFAYLRTRADPQPQALTVYTLARETHAADLVAGQKPNVQHSFSYSDGLGREIQKKVQAEPDNAGASAGAPRWVGSGWTIFNNKGKPVRQYEPFFSATHHFEFAPLVGVSPILFYDPLDRVIATLHPNQSYQKVVFDAWRQDTWDANDTVLADPRTDDDVKGLTQNFFASLPNNPPWQTWYAQRQGAALGAHEQAAAVKASAHANTPTVAHVDSIGRPFLTLAHNGFDPQTQPILYASRVDLDILGKQRAVRDASIQAGDAQGRVIMRYDYDLLGNCIHHLSMETGPRWMLGDAAGKAIWVWNSRGHGLSTQYDVSRRPLRVFVTGIDPATPDRALLTERFVYGEQHPQGEMQNLLARVYLHLDQAGAAVNDEHDFKGNPLVASRRIAVEYRQTLDWAAVDATVPPGPAKLDPDALKLALGPRLEGDVYTNHMTYDALNRMLTLTMPDNCMIRHGYNAANLLERVDATLSAVTGGSQPVWTAFVANIDYDARGQRLRIDYGNAIKTVYEYDPLTFRLTHLVTQRDAAAFPNDCPQLPPGGWPGCQLQNLRYTYDAAGNVTHVDDSAQQTVYFRNKRVEPSADYTYDPLYRLIEATGREHLGQVGGAPIPHSWNDAPRVGIAWSGNDGNAMGTYVERYLYDAAGNFLETRHRGSDPANPGWTRSYAYDETSFIENGAAGAPRKTSNQLSRTTIGGASENYRYDAHGNMTRMPQLGAVDPAPNITWDYRDQLGKADLGGGGTAYYVYDAAGQRVRKVWEKSTNLVEERVYLGAFEIFRRRQGTTRLVRKTLHVMDDKRRIALVETRTLDMAGTDTSPAQLTRYQLSNQLDSCCLELDAQAQLISYEEYTPYGSTSYQAVRSQTETPKRFRYTSKERDEETGLYYNGARYYAPWLGRWTACDPAVLAGGWNLYVYSRNSPIGYHDPTGLAEEDTIGESFRAGGNGNLPRPGTLDIDEIQAISRGGSWSSASNKRFDISVNNRFTKKDFDFMGPAPPPRSQISLAEEFAKGEEAFLKAAGQITFRTFGEVKELEKITNDAVAALRNTNRSPRELANAVNRSIRGRIAREATDETKIVARAMRATGIDPKTLSLVKQDVVTAESSAKTAAAALKSSGPAAAVSEAAAPSRFAGAISPAGEALHMVSVFAGRALTVVGAKSEADRMVNFELQHDRGALNAALMGTTMFAAGVAAGAFDDALAIAEAPLTGGAITMGSWEQNGAGPMQHAIGEAMRGFLEWSFKHGL
ncbi:SpvB/TcaC N-terminal domain-containing protein [Bradyrhizobium sp. SZCCHNR1051]|uniref:SpvB/TcaC N-terminal domain-containing protein n=1 Tax=Bradyrhizobium sp. SZCCHNR1051 TaxID=3057355 RepID=UPI0029163B8A|nr:SpvB/TcaC N-terminal domain-containing protein [Bradyrhizobium sp. SZCCHNR1051]